MKIIWGCVDGRSGKYEANSVKALHFLIDLDEITNDDEKNMIKFGPYFEFDNLEYKNYEITVDNGFSIQYTINSEEKKKFKKEDYVKECVNNLNKKRQEARKLRRDLNENNME